MIAGSRKQHGDQQQKRHADRAQGDRRVLQLAVGVFFSAIMMTDGDHRPRGLPLHVVPGGVIARSICAMIDEAL